MAKGQRDQTAGQALGQTIRQGSGKPRKSGRAESDRRQVWSGKDRIRNETDQGQTQVYQSIVDRCNHLCAEPGQLGRGSTDLSGFFSMFRTPNGADHFPNIDSSELGSKKPVQVNFWTGFKNRN